MPLDPPVISACILALIGLLAIRSRQTELSMAT
jgi:hypothetical protein